MSHAHRTMSMMIGGVVLLSGSAASAQDWPQWRGTNRDAKATGFKAPATWPKELTQKWKVTIGDGVATPALVGDKLYVFSRQGGDEVIHCLDANTGKELWQDKYTAEPATGAAGSFPGPRSSPTVADGKVVTLGVRGMLSCLDATTGKVVWRTDTQAWPRFFTASSPIVVNGLCITEIGGQSSGGVAAYDLATGNEKWKWNGDGPAYASPVILKLGGEQVVVAETDKNIVGLDVGTGKILWEMAYPVQGRMGYNASTPIVEGETLIYSGSGRGTKAVKIEKKGAALAGKELWSNPEKSVQFNTPVLKDGFLYGISATNELFCINAQTGKTAWTAPLGQAAPAGGGQPPAGGAGGAGGRGGRGGRGMGMGRGGYGSIVDASSVLFALTPSSELIVFQPSDKEFKQLAKYKIADTPTYAYPVVSGNRLFVKDRDSVILWVIP